MKGKISVIIPVFNPGKHLRKCLDSIINQTYSNLEIILIDDGSTDGSANICEEYAQKDLRIICIHQSNLGVSSARNKGLEIASGEYLHFPDSDDYLEMDTYEYVLNIMHNNGCDAAAFEHYVTYPDHEVVHKLDESFYGIEKGEQIQEHLMKGSQFCWNKLFKRTLVKNIRFPNDIYRGEDTVFSAYVLDNAKKVIFDSRPLYHYVQSEESACRGQFRINQMTVLKLYDAYKPLYSEKYPNMYVSLCIFLQDVLISLYYDIWADDNRANLKKERKQVYHAVKEHSQLIYKSRRCSNKQITKMHLFLNSPNLFCVCHKLIHNL